jgi:outer membrane protein
MNVHAAEGTSLKIAVVDMQRAIQSVEAGKKAKSQLEKEINEKRKNLQTEEATIKKMGEEFKKQSLVMSDEARSKKQAELQEKIFKFQEETQKTQQELQQKEATLTEPIVSKLRNVISDLAKQKGYNFVLEKNENMVLYFDDKDDLTGDVVSLFNKQNKS